MSEAPEQKKSARPSLYEPRETPSSFSVLGGVSPLGWSKQKVILASVTSFILGSLLGGSVVGLAQKPDTTMMTSISTVPPVVAQKNVPVIVEAKPAAVSTVPVAVASMKGAEAAKLPTESSPPTNPLASFTEGTPAEKAQQLADENLKNLELQKKLEAKKHARALAKAEKLKVEKEREAEMARAEKLALEKSEKMKADKLKAAKADKAKAIAKTKKQPTHDKDVMLVKSLLDTMDRPVAKPKVVVKKVTPPTGS